ncbi:MAG: tyrosine-type recombinase/integrase [Xanthobacteraceae bacterium]
MPLKLRPPRPGKTPNYEIRGTYLGVTVERSAGTADKKIAQRQLREIMRAVERGEYDKKVIATSTQPTFLSAAVAYLKAGGEGKYLGPIIEMKGADALRDCLLTDIDQIKINNAASALYPSATPQTQNRQFYTPVSAVLKHVGVEGRIKRPKGWRGSRARSWLEPEPAFALIEAASALDREFGLLCITLLYTGMRISEALRAKLRHLNLDQATLYLPETKNGEARTVYLPPIVVNALQAMAPRSARPNKATAKDALARGEPGRNQIDAGIPFLKRSPDMKLFRFYQGGRLRKRLADAMESADLSFPPRQRGFHLFCHTYGTWMVRFGKLDNFGLTRTGRWKDPRSAEVYVHTAVNAEAQLASLLPTPGIRGKSGERRRRSS